MSSNFTDYSSLTALYQTQHFSLNNRPSQSNNCENLVSCGTLKKRKKKNTLLYSLELRDLQPNRNVAAFYTTMKRSRFGLVYLAVYQSLMDYLMLKFYSLIEWRLNRVNFGIYDSMFCFPILVISKYHSSPPQLFEYEEHDFHTGSRRNVLWFNNSSC